LRSCYSVGDATIQAAEGPLHGLDPDRAHACMHFWHYRTTDKSVRPHQSNRKSKTHVFLLFVYMSDLEPNIFFCQRGWWYRDNISETLQLIRISTQRIRMNDLPLNSVRISAVVYKLCPGGSRSHSPSQNLVACALLVKMPLRHVRGNRIYHRVFQCRTKVSVPGATTFSLFLNATSIQFY
jgi:hypothetical protein